MNTQAIANRVVELGRAGQFDQIQEELFSEDAENIEMPEMSSGPLGNAKGFAAIRKKSADWSAGLETIHSMTVGDPIVAGNWFALPMTLDVTMKGAGRMRIEEICVYRVRNGKIVREQFFYDVD